MRIVVCVKHVPDMEAERGFDERALALRGDDDVLNGVDENALEAALTLVEDVGDGEVIALTMGPEDAADAIASALQMGAIAGYHVSDERAAGSDVVGTARVLAAAIERIAAERGRIDLVLTGMTALDSLTGMVPSALAAYLKVPVISNAMEIALDDPLLTITRRAGQVEETLAVSMPAVLSISDQANEPRYPNFKAIAAARKRPVEQWCLDDLDISDDAAIIGLAGAASRVAAATEKAGRGGGEIITDTGDGGSRLGAWIAERM